MLDRLRDAWDWLFDDLDSKYAERAVNDVRDALTMGEHALVQLIHAAFLLLEIVMIFGMFIMMVPFMIIATELFGPYGLFLGIAASPLLWLLLRKPRALLKSALLRSFVRRAGRRAAPLVLDSTSASASPVAVSVDVDHEA